MYTNDDIIEKLGLSHLSQAEQEAVLIKVHTLIGEAIVEHLTEQQYNEYEAIINANNSVIQSWLAQNVPEYKNSEVYEELEASYKDDPEHNDPAKIFANLAWVEKNVTNKQEIVDKVIADYQQSGL